jgi:hypothetical protein
MLPILQKKTNQSRLESEKLCAEGKLLKKIKIISRKVTNP